MNYINKAKNSIKILKNKKIKRRINQMLKVI